MKASCMALLLLFAATVAHARIFETEEQIEKRYGKPVGNEVIDGVSYRIFNYERMRIRVLFLNKKSNEEEFEKIGNTLGEDVFAFSENEENAILTANASDWEVLHKNELQAVWKSEKQKLFANDNKVLHRIRVGSTYADTFLKAADDHPLKGL